MYSSLDEILHHYPEVTGIHPACLAVPAISDDELKTLCDDIKNTGLRHEIVLDTAGLLVDGRHRLIACYEGQIEPRFKQTVADPWVVAFSENIARRHLQVGQKAAFVDAWRADASSKAKERRGTRTDLVEIFPPSSGHFLCSCGEEFSTAVWHCNKCGGHTPEGGQYCLNCGKDAPQKKAAEFGKARDKLGEMAGISGKSVDKYRKIKGEAPDVAEQVAAGAITLEAGFKEAKKREQQNKANPVDAPKPADKPKPADATTDIITASGKITQIRLPSKVVFNSTNDSVDWANWTWNPVTGCEHGCNFCYAREIANSVRMADYYPNGFEPTFHEYRLDAPKNMKPKKSDDPRDGRVFVCSMADLFGKWVPIEWIEAVFAACLQSPEWEYLFLTKWPARYSQMPLINRAWYGASVIQQADVSRVENAMQKIKSDSVTLWISLEPMLGPIKFNSLAWCDLVVIGAQTSTNQPDGFVPAVAPEFDWIVDVVNQCRDAGVPYYLKENLGLVQPGMKLPKSQPRRP